MVDKLRITELPKVETKAQLAEELNKAIPMAWLSAFCNKRLDNATIQETVTQIESEGGYENASEFVHKLASELNAKPDMREKGGTGESRKSGKLILTYSVTGTPKPFGKQDKLNGFKAMKAQAEELGVDFPYQAEIDNLEAEKKTWDAKYNSQLKLDKAKSSNVDEVIEKICARFDSAFKAVSKVSDLNPALDTITSDVIEPLKSGTQEDKDKAEKLSKKIALLRKMVAPAKAFEVAMLNITQSCTVDKGNKVVDLHENPEQRPEA